MHIYKIEEYGQLERIKELMEEKTDSTGKKGITQEKLALAIGVDKSNVNKWFKKGVQIRKSNLLKIADYLDCDVEYLECKQNTPRKSKSTKIKFTPQSELTYLYKIQDLVSSTKQRFTFNIVPDCEFFKIIEGNYIDGEYRYYYEDIETEYGNEWHYEIKFNNGERLNVSETQLKNFVNRIMKFVSFEIDQLKE